MARVWWPAVVKAGWRLDTALVVGPDFVGGPRVRTF